MRQLTSVDRDPLSAVLQTVRFKSAIYCRSELSAPWGFSVLGRDFATFHLVSQGRGCLQVDGLKSVVWLDQGDLVILPTGRAHTMRDAPSSTVTRLEDLVAGAPPDATGTVRGGGGGAETVLVCGGFQYDDGNNPLLTTLPPLIHLRGSQRRTDGWLNLTLAYLAEEAESVRPGADATMVRLADLLFIEAVRAYAAAPGAPRLGLAAALRDPRIATAVLSIHREPHEKWDIRRLARHAAMSRAAFADRFTLLVGESPISYVTRCRMNLATGLLASSHSSLADVAARAGYESEASFGRAFKRHVGISPAAYRRQRMRFGGSRGPMMARDRTNP